MNALETWLEDNGIYSKQAHSIANRLFNTVLCITLWEAMENEFYTELYREYEKCSCETETAVKILLEKLPDFTDRYYVQKVWLEIQKNKQRINELFEKSGTGLIKNPVPFCLVIPRTVKSYEQNVNKVFSFYQTITVKSCEQNMNKHTPFRS